MTNCGALSANPLDDADDTAAVEAATTQLAAAAGGGHVYFPPAEAGAYLVSNVGQRSNVDYYGSDAATTTLKRLGSASPWLPMLRSHVWSTTGWITKNTPTLHVDDASMISVGDVIAVRGSGGPNPIQTSTLALPMLAQSTTLTIPAGGSGSTDWADQSESRYLIVENELISYTQKTGNTFTGLGRGVHSSAALHPVGATVSQALQLIAEVTSVNLITKEVTLDRAAKFTVSSTANPKAPVLIGSSHMSVRNLTLDGNQPMGGYALNGATPWPMNYKLARDLEVTGCVIRNGDDGGIRLEHGTRDALIENNKFIDNGEEVAPGSSHVWLFLGAIRTIVNDNLMSGPMFRGIVSDDRTEHASVWDAPSNFNEITNNTVDMREDPETGPEPPPPFSWPIGIGIAGAWAPDDPLNNVVSGNQLIANQLVSGGGIGVYVGVDGTQGTAPLNSNATYVSANTFAGQVTGILTAGVNNTFDGNSFSAVDTPCNEVSPASGNSWTNNGPTCVP